MSWLVAASNVPLVLPKIAYYSILPEIILLGGAVAILATSSIMRRPMDHNTATTMTVMTALAALSLALVQWAQVQSNGPHVAIDGAVVQDGFSAFIAVLVSGAVVVSALVIDGWTRREHTVGPELHVLTLASASGAVIMGEANDLIVIFLGLEIMSIALYVLAAMNAKRNQSGEAALKYFVLGSFSSAVFLYGIALVYGATGTTNLPQIADYLARNVLLHNGLLLAGLALLLVGFGFKVAAVPFHLWTPDVYQGAPTPVTGFMAAIAKAGGFAALLRVFVSSFGTLRMDWQPAVWVIAIVTLILGASVALVQRDIKRMLAYSSINHAGFILLGLQAASARGVEASLYYLFVYAFMVIGTFAVVTVVGGAGDGAHDLGRYRGLASRQPWLAAALTVLLMAQAGIPFTTGFLAKLEVVEAAVKANSTALAVVAMVTAVIAAFFYLRIILLMYSSSAGLDGAGAAEEYPEPVPAPAVRAAVGVAAGAGATAGQVSSGSVAARDAEPRSVEAAAASTADDDADLRDGLDVPPGMAVAVAVCVGVTILFGLWPSPIVNFAHHAVLYSNPFG
ncbi:MAG TPA: NADH-quinone oxidoreductase subunit N [Acidimicrobiales bacterium]|jgi:NADH-quinone oxidoreductase subunit N